MTKTGYIKQGKKKDHVKQDRPARKEGSSKDRMRDEIGYKDTSDDK